MSSFALRRSVVRAIFAVFVVSFLGGCVSHRLYNSTPELAVRSLASEDGETSADLAIIEFDDQGTFWDLSQLEGAIDLIGQRNKEADRGVLTVVYVHGWQNNADPDRGKGDLEKFKAELLAIASGLDTADAARPDRVVGVYLGWRGATTRVPIAAQLTFWDRRATAERVVSLNMREAIFRVMNAVNERDASKCFVVGHSMGGLIVGKTLSPSLSTLVLTAGPDGARMPADLVVLQNPALDALASWQFIDFLKRSKARVELRRDDGSVEDAKGPLIVSITSEADSATGSAYPFGRTVTSLFSAFRGAIADDGPSQRYLATHAEGHVDYLVSHRAFVENGELKIERVPDAFNDTPFWVIRVTKDISKNHGDTRNPRMGELVARVSEMNGLYEAGVQTWMVTGE